MIQPNHHSFRVLQREALDWLMRVSAGDAPGGELRQFEAWRGQSALHAEAYRSALKIWQSMGEAGRQVPAEMIAAAKSPPAGAFFSNRRMLLGGGLPAKA